MQLADLTGGIASDLCDQNFQPVFDLLATEVISGSELSCSWPLPEAEGQDVDPSEVNVEFDDGMGNVEVIGKVETEAACADVADGWYYDDPAQPKTIIACPQTCDRIQGVENAKIDIAVGCETIPAG